MGRGGSCNLNAQRDPRRSEASLQMPDEVFNQINALADGVVKIHLQDGLAETGTRPKRVLVVLRRRARIGC